MTPTVQALVVALIVGIAVAYVARRFWRSLRASKASADAACGDGCGCDPPTSHPP